MRFLKLFIFNVCFFSGAFCKNSGRTAALTESLGQEVIEISNPVKALPPGLEEEPSAENEEEDVTSSAAPIPGTKKKGDTRRRMKDVDILDGVTPDDEEARIEKELAEVYKDTADYNSAEGLERNNGTRQGSSTDSSTFEDKPIGRTRGENFRFQPEGTAPADIEKFRTSVDDINCGRVLAKHKLDEDSNDNGDSSSNKMATDLTLYFISVLAVSSLLH